MVSKTLQVTAETLGFTYVEKSSSAQTHMYGVYGGYLTTLYDSGNHKTAFVNYQLITNDEDESVRLLEISEALKETFLDLNILDYSVEIDGLSCTASCSVESFFEFLDRIIEFLGKEEIHGVTHCCSCGNKIGKRFPKKVYIDKHNYLFCEYCALEKIESNAQDAKDNHNLPPKKVGVGIMGSLIGGFIGILIYFLVYYFISPIFSNSAFEIRYVLSLLGFATAALVFHGYKFFCKRCDISAYVSVSTVTLISVSLAQYLGSFAEYAKLQNFSLGQAVKIPSMWLIHLRSTIDTSITYSQNVLDLYNVSPLFYKLLCFSLLFALIGTIIFLLGFYEKSKIKVSSIEVETLRISKEEVS